MDLHSPQDAHLRELLDALRAGSDDLSRSEFAELAARLHAFRKEQREKVLRDSELGEQPS